MRARIGQALLGRNLSAERPVAILSGNDLDHAMLALGCMYAGVPYAPISPAYSLISSDFAKLKHITGLLTPGLVFAADGQAFERAIEAAIPADIEVVVSRNPLSARRCLAFSELAKTAATPAIDAANGRAGARHHRQIPVHLGLDRRAQGRHQHQPHVVRQPGDAAGGACVLAGRAAGHRRLGAVAPHRRRQSRRRPRALQRRHVLHRRRQAHCPAIGETVRTLREIAPTWYFKVPKGFEALLPYLRSDETLRRNFFSRLKVLWFAGAGIAQHVFDEVQQLAVETCGERILFLTGFGSTETAPYALARTWHSDNRHECGPARSRPRHEARPDRRQARRPRAGAEHHAGLLAADPS